MEDQDKLYEQFKDAAGRAEQKGFDRMESVWNRVEEKLDNKKQRSIAAWWKYTGIAAIFLLFLTVCFFMLNENNTIVAPENTPENNITVIDTQKVNEAFIPEKATVTDVVVVNEAENVPKIEAAISTSSADSTTFINGARFSRSKNINNPQYAFVAKKAELPPGGMVSGFAADQPSADSDTHKGFITFSGTVSDPTGPLPGAGVAVKSTDKYVATDINGRFSIEVPEGEQLEISYVGYNSRIIAANSSNNNANIMVDDSGVLLESAIVDSYRSDVLQKAAAEPVSKKDARRDRKAEREAKKAAAVTSATLTPPSETATASSFMDQNRPTAGHDYANASVAIKQKESLQAIPERANASGTHAVQGQTAGITIASGAGKPGADDIILRGMGTVNGTEPLYIINGNPANKADAEALKEADIVEINILKDAAATAIYGNRGANGVIVITTKANLTKKELRKLKRENEKLEKEQKKAKKDSIDFTKAHK